MKKLLTTTAIMLALAGGVATQAHAYIFGDDDVVIEDIIIVYGAEQPSEYFYEAKGYYMEGYNDLAAARIRKGAKSLARAAETATPEGKKALLASYAELNEMAEDIEDDEYITIHYMNKEFAKSLYNLSHHQYMMAKESWAKKAYKKTGEAMTAAANNLRHATSWAGKTLEKGGVAVVDGARSAGQALKKGAGWTEDKVGKGIEGLGDQLTKLGKKLEK